MSFCEIFVNRLQAQNVALLQGFEQNMSQLASQQQLLTANQSGS